MQQRPILQWKICWVWLMLLWFGYQSRLLGIWLWVFRSGHFGIRQVCWPSRTGPKPRIHPTAGHLNFNQCNWFEYLLPCNFHQCAWTQDRLIPRFRTRRPSGTRARASRYKKKPTAEFTMLPLFLAALSVSAVKLLLRDATSDVMPFTSEQRVQVAKAVRKTFEVLWNSLDIC